MSNVLVAIFALSGHPDVVALESFYWDEKADAAITFLSETRYEVWRARPLKVPYRMRHVDFEDGTYVIRGGRVVLSPNWCFESPTRNSYMELFGMTPSSLASEFPLKRDQDRLRAELKWRVTTGAPTHILLLLGRHPNRRLVLGGLTFRNVRKQAKWR